MKKILIPFVIICLLFFFEFANAQKMVPKNLVPNPSFEQVNLPLRPNLKNYFEHEPLSGFIPFQTNLVFWKSANRNTPDLRLVERKNYSDCDREFDYCVKPKTGRLMIGIITYMSNYSSDTYREYITLKLKSTVKPGIKTYVELWICKDRKAKLVANNIGFYFSQRPVHKDIRENLELRPQVNWTEVVNKDGQKWEKISGWFIPEKPLIYLTIGNFYNNEHTIKEDSDFHSAHPRLEEYASYLIDDVRVWQEDDTLEEEPVYPITQKEPVILEDIHFETNSAKLLDSSIKELNSLLALLKKHPKLKIAIHGHTDNRGEDTFNFNLSDNRAKAVVSFLKNGGIEEERLDFKGFGENKPIASNDNQTGRLINRRVEFVVID